MTEEHLQRMCIFCRKSAGRKELLRFVIEKSRLVLDEAQNMPGRGAYMHPRIECWTRMKDHGRWRHAFDPKSKRHREGRTEGQGVVIDKASIEAVQEVVRMRLINVTGVR